MRLIREEAGGDGSGRIVCHSDVDEVCLSRTAVTTHTYAFISSIDDFGTLVTTNYRFEEQERTSLK